MATPSCYSPFFFIFLLHASYLTGGEPFIGVNYGQVADNLPPPEATAKLLQTTAIEKVRLYGADPAIIKALANTGIGIVIGAANGDIPAMAGDSGFATSWLASNVLPFYPASNIVLITVGNEVFLSGDRTLMTQLLPALRNLQNAIEAASLGGKIKVSTVHSMAVLHLSEPPSSGRFDPGYGDLMKDLLEFNNETGSPFPINPYPFFAYQSDPRPETLAFCLFQSNAGRVDLGTNIKYTNMFDAQVATRLIASVAANSSATGLLCRGPLLIRRSSLGLNLSFTKKRLFTCRALYKPEVVQVKEEGQPETLDYRVFFHDDSGKKVSPWHDVPLHMGDGVFSFIVEIPKESSAKMEVATDEVYTPIKQDTKKGKLRYYPYNINWNYGLLPQTWEDPSFANSEVEGAFGDNDPVDVVEIGETRGKIGQIMKVKPLGALAMIDEGELDWKIVAISLDDPRASLVNDVGDVEKHFPGTLTAIRDWFRDYKIPDGKPANKFGLGNKAANKDYALKVITETNESWAKLVKRSIPAGELSLV